MKSWPEILLAVALLSCGPEADVCGVNSIELVGSEDCAGFGEQVGRTIFALRRKFTGDTWHGLEVEVVPDAWLMGGRRVAGVTLCRWGRVVIAAAGDWRNTALAHEFAHFGQCPVEDVEHSSWLELGLWRAVDEANR